MPGALEGPRQGEGNLNSQQSGCGWEGGRGAWGFQASDPSSQWDSGAIFPAREARGSGDV